MAADLQDLAISVRLVSGNGKPAPATDTTVRARIDDRIKKQAAHVLEDMGLSVSDAIRMLLVRVAAEKALPFDVKVPNATTARTLRKADKGVGQWVFGRERQEALSELFFRRVAAKQSLVFFYTKSGHPLDESISRLIVGVGMLDWMSGIQRYDVSAGPRYPLWDRLITHSVRPDGSRGMLLPYHDYLEPSGDPDEQLAFGCPSGDGWSVATGFQ